METLTRVRTKCCNVQHIYSLALPHYGHHSVCFILHYSALLNAPTPANDNSAVTLGVLFGGVAIGVVAVLMVLGIVCGVYKLRKWKKQPTSTETNPTAENKSVVLSVCCTFGHPQRSKMCNVHGGNLVIVYM